MNNFHKFCWKIIFILKLLLHEIDSNKNEVAYSFISTSSINHHQHDCWDLVFADSIIQIFFRFYACFVHTFVQNFKFLLLLLLPLDDLGTYRNKICKNETILKLFVGCRWKIWLDWLLFWRIYWLGPVFDLSLLKLLLSLPKLLKLLLSSLKIWFNFLWKFPMPPKSSPTSPCSHQQSHHFNANFLISTWKVPIKQFQINSNDISKKKKITKKKNYFDYFYSSFNDFLFRSIVFFFHLFPVHIYAMSGIKSRRRYHFLLLDILFSHSLDSIVGSISREKIRIRIFWRICLGCGCSLTVKNMNLEK